MADSGNEPQGKTFLSPVVDSVVNTPELMADIHKLQYPRKLERMESTRLMASLKKRK